MKKKSERQKGVISLVLLAAVFAMHGLFPRFLSTGFALFQQVYLRTFIALILGLIIFSKRIDFTKLRKTPKKDILLIFIRAAAMFVGGIVLGSQALILTKYSNVNFIGALPATALLGIILLREKVTLPKVFFVLLAFVGVMIIAVKDYSHLFEWGFGEFLALISAFSFSLSYVFRKWESNYLNNFEVTQLIFFFGVIMLFSGSLIRGEGLPLTGWTLPLMLAILTTGVLNIVSLFLINYSFERVDAFLGNNMLTLAPLFAVLFGFLVFQETPTLKEFFGGTSHYRKCYLDESV